MREEERGMFTFDSGINFGAEQGLVSTPEVYMSHYNLNFCLIYNDKLIAGYVGLYVCGHI